MKTFQEIKKENNISNYIILNESDFSYMEESEKAEVQNMLIQIGDKKLSELDESFLGSLLGGVAGFIVGPTIGRVIANALGIEKGIIYDLLTSHLCCAALGAALTKYMGGRK